VLDTESKVETLSTCKRSVAETLFSAKSTLERGAIEMISVCHSARDAESRVETWSSCKRGAVKNIFSARSTLEVSAHIGGCALDSVSSTE
jgi:Lhr-like helicase